MARVSAALPAVESTLAVPGAELALRRWSHGSTGSSAPESGRAIICLHETGATAASWKTLAEQLSGTDFAADLIAFDRRGWGGSTAPELYLRTTIAEQARDALLVLDHLDIAEAILCGAGLGAVAALDLALREPSRISAAVAIEPPLLALAEGATEGLSQDVETLRKAVEAEDSGRAVAADLVLAGELPFLAPGAERLPAREVAGGGDGQEVRRNLGTLFAELGAVPAWSLPFEDLAQTPTPITIVTGQGTPAPVQAAAEALATYAPSAQPIRLGATDPLLAPNLAEQLTL